MARPHLPAARRLAAGLAIALLGGTSLLGCGSSGGDAADEERTTTSEAATTTEAAATTAEATATTEAAETTTTEAAETTTTEVGPFGDDVEEGLVDGFVAQISGYLEASSIDADQVDCLVAVFERSATDDLDEAAVEAGYEDCGSSTAEVGIATIEGLLLTSGASEEAAACMVDELSAIPTAELDAAMEDPAVIEDLASGCGVPADLFPS